MSRISRICVAILVVTAALRLATLGAYPLADTTEARYSETARLMLVSDDWITPQIEAGVPFWGKPPLSIWLTATSFKAFGLSEFTARLPALVLLLACVWLVIGFGEVTVDRATGLAAGMILITTALGFICAGTVMTDPALLLSTTLAMVAFWRAVVGSQYRWGYVFFVALALGLLAKGPIAWVLSLTPIGIWVLWRRQWVGLRAALPWVSGILLIALIAVPWYWAAEAKTPGFLNYFLIGEHWLRFVDSGWSGDLYGSAHAEIRGMVWPFWLASALPWSLIAIVLIVRWRRDAAHPLWSEWHRYLALWAITPMLFFTFAGNILPAYVLPGLPAFALLLAKPLVTRASKLVHAGWLIPAVFTVLGPFSLFDHVADRSQHEFINYVRQDAGVERLIYLYDRPYSANFYSRGEVSFAASAYEAGQYLDRPGRDYLVIRASRVNALPQSLAARLEVEKTHARYVLLVESPSN